MQEKGKERMEDLPAKAGETVKEQAEHAFGFQRNSGDSPDRSLVDGGVISSNSPAQPDGYPQPDGYQPGIPRIPLDRYDIDRDIIGLVPETLARRHNLVPVKKEGDVLTIAMGNPLNLYALDGVRLVTGMDVRVVAASEKDIRVALECYYGRQTVEKAIDDFNKEHGKGVSPGQHKAPSIHVKNAPVVRLVDSIIEQAAAAGASDIHIEPGEADLRIRFRVDGVLREMFSTSMHTHGAIVTRIKIMGSLDIAERRVPQDGRIETEVMGKRLDLRVSTLPTVYGEKVALRILDRADSIMSREQLGFSGRDMEIFDGMLKAPYGMVVVTGPTGSGKTTTLYTALRELNSTAVNIITLEDPVEYRLEGVNQIQVHPKAGLTFAGGLRSILRQDPDIIMVGEIRDEETANLAARAAITGHLVFSTLHTNHAAGAILRLVDMGVQPYLVAASVIGVICQRLVRKICPECKIPYSASEEELRLLDMQPGDTAAVYKGRGCSVCDGTGYRGRTAVYEIMAITRRHREMIRRRMSSDRLVELSARTGMHTIKDSCRELVVRGITSTEEMIKVVYAIDRG